MNLKILRNTFKSLIKLIIIMKITIKSLKIAIN